MYNLQLVAVAGSQNRPCERTPVFLKSYLFDFPDREHATCHGLFFKKVVAVSTAFFFF
jgi:hypothetical protein